MTITTPIALPPGLDDLRVAYGDLEGRALLDVAIKTVFSGRIALVSSFGAESAVLLHMVAEIDARVPVIFLNTGKLFGETLRYRDAMVGLLGLSDVRSIEPKAEDVAREDHNGLLWIRDADACCALRKVRPLARALGGFDAWITGRKRFQSEGRDELPTIERVAGRIKINPLATWSQDDLERYIRTHKLPAHPLVADGYPSIGCMPCTRRVRPGETYRAGRWADLDKTECGIHIGDGI